MQTTESPCNLDRIYQVEHYINIVSTVSYSEELNRQQKKDLFETAILYFNQMKQNYDIISLKFGLKVTKHFMTKMRYLSECIQSTTFFLYPELYSDQLNQFQIDAMHRDADTKQHSSMRGREKPSTYTPGRSSPST